MPGRPESSTDALRSVSDVARSRRIPSRRAGSKARADGGSPGEGAVAGSDGPAQPVADLAHAIRLEVGEGQPQLRLLAGSEDGARQRQQAKIGRAPGRERVCQYVDITRVAGSFKKNNKKN